MFNVISSQYYVETTVGSYLGTSIAFIFMAILINNIGYKKIMKLIPNHVAGSIIIVLGISLVPVSFSLMQDNYFLALVSAMVMILCSITPIKIDKIEKYLKKET